jgi:hypothetical protein
MKTTFKKMRKSLADIALDRKKKKSKADPEPAPPADVLGKKVLDPKVNPCGPEAGFDEFTPYKNLWVNVTR